MKASEKISQLLEVGQEVELELREKEDAFYTGKVVELGENYLVLSRKASMDVEQGGEKVLTKSYKVTTLILLKDIRALSVMELISQDEMLTTDDG